MRLIDLDHGLGRRLERADRRTRLRRATPRPRGGSPPPVARVLPGPADVGACRARGDRAFRSPSAGVVVSVDVRPRRHGGVVAAHPAALRRRRGVGLGAADARRPVRVRLLDLLHRGAGAAGRGPLLPGARPSAMGVGGAAALVGRARASERVPARRACVWSRRCSRFATGATGRPCGPRPSRPLGFLAWLAYAWHRTGELTGYFTMQREGLGRLDRPRSGDLPVRWSTWSRSTGPSRTGCSTPRTSSPACIGLVLAVRRRLDPVWIAYAGRRGGARRS